MLKFKINKNNTVLTAENFSYKSVTFNENEGYILFETNFPHRFKNNDQIRFQNKVNDTIFTIDKYVTVVDETKFQVELFAPYTLFLNNVSETTIPYGWNGSIEEALVLTFGKPHDFIKERKKEYVKANLTGSNEDAEIIKGLNNNDLVLCYNLFLYKIEKNGEIPTISQNYENIECEIYVKHDGENKKLKCIVPIDIDGTDNQYSLVCFRKDNIEIFDFLKNNKQFTSVFKDDTRFVYVKDINGNSALTMRDNTEIYKLSGNFHVEIPTFNNFATNLHQTEIVERDFVDIETEKAINQIVNMEKYSFSPVCFMRSGNDIDNPENFLPIKEINFNFHFRDRSGSDDWTTDDSKYWNSYKKNGEHLVYRSNAFFSDEQSDLLGYLNFTDNDVLYQKSKLKKSFVRLSFYDKRDIRLQKLLFYSTTFVDSGTLFGKYAKNINKSGYVDSSGNAVGGIGVYNEYGTGPTVDESKRLSTHLTIKDKYNSDASSEGFYLYLFAETAPKYVPESIYMKVEYNHAGYGRTIPFVMPTKMVTNLGTVPISATDNDFPIDYLIKDVNKVDMERLYKDMFIEIRIKYDYKNNQYVWYLPRYYEDYNDGKMIFNLFEPKIQ